MARTSRSLSSSLHNRHALSNQRGRKTSFEQLETRTLMAGDAILHWNKIAMDVVSADHSGTFGAAEHGGPTRTARAMAIVHTAMFDAINSIKGQYEPYLIKVVGVGKANIDAAVGQAARDTLAKLYPNQRTVVNAALKDWLGMVPNGKAEDLGISLGKVVAAAMLKSRNNDGSSAPADYQFVNLPGHHQKDPINPTQGILDPHWGKVKTFGIKNADQFLPPPPPSMTSAEYTKNYKELLKYGGDGVNSPTQRTAEQTEIGIFWAYDGTQGLCAPPRMYNQIAAQIGQEQGNSEYENARLLALVNVAMADAGVVAWDAKYEYDLWRPVVGIRGGDTDGNPNTVGDAGWTPLGAPASNQTLPNDFTPPFPAYVSGHATFGAALFKTLERFYGTHEISFSFTSDEFNGVTTDKDGNVRPEVTRDFDNLRYAAYENGISRIYLGIHWRFDATRGIQAGNRIANRIFGQIMEPLQKIMPQDNTLVAFCQTLIQTRLMKAEDGVNRQVVLMNAINGKVTSLKTHTADTHHAAAKSSPSLASLATSTAEASETLEQRRVRIIDELLAAKGL